MATAAEMEVKVDKLEVNMDRFDEIINGDASTDVPVDVGTVPSIRKLQEQLREAQEALSINWNYNVIEARSTANVNLATGLVNGQTLNGVTVQTGKFYFLGLQTDPKQNGIYPGVASGTAPRATWADSAAELAHIGFLISGGTTGAGELYTLDLDVADITLGTTNLNFAKVGIPVSVTTEVANARQGLGTLLENLVDIRNELADEIAARIAALGPVERATAGTDEAPDSTPIIGGRRTTLGDYFDATVDSNKRFVKGLGKDGEQEYMKLYAKKFSTEPGVISIDIAPIHLGGIGDISDLFLDRNRRPYKAITTNGQQYTQDPTTGLLAPSGSGSGGANRETYAQAGGMTYNTNHNTIYTFIVWDQSWGYGASAGTGEIILNPTPTHPGYALMMDNSQAVKTAHIVSPTPVAVYPFGDDFINLVEAAIPGAYETQCSGFANWFIEKHLAATGFKPKVLMMIAAVGGAPYDAIRKGTATYNAIMTALQKAVGIAAARGLGERIIVCDILTDHGQQDTSNGVLAREYEKFQLQAIADFNADILPITNQSIPVRMLANQVSRGGSLTAIVRPEIGLGWTRAAEKDPRIAIVGPAYQFKTAAGDGAHLSSIGYNTNGRTKADRAVAQILGHDKPVFEVLSAKKISSTVIRLEFSSPTTIDLSGTTVADTGTNGKGWVFDDNSGASPSISSVAKVVDTSVTASISSTVMTVASGSGLKAGQTLTGAGVSSGTYIVNQLTGTTGGAGTYTVSISQTVASTTISASSNLVDVTLSGAPANRYDQLWYSKSGNFRETVPLGNDNDGLPFYRWQRIQLINFNGPGE